jgi:hypothetical protein
MQDKLEKLIKLVYKKYKAGHITSPSEHPNEEAIACFIEGKLPVEEENGLKQHLTECRLCAEAFMAQVTLDSGSEPDVPRDLIAKVKNLITQEKLSPVLEILLKLKDDLIELLSTNGDVLVGQELVPAPILRSRQIKGFKDEVTILKDFGGIRVEIKIEKMIPSAFSVVVNVKDKQNLQVIKDLRITLMKNDLELESYINDSGRVIFEHVVLGKYTVEIADIKDKLAAILLDIRS